MLHVGVVKDRDRCGALQYSYVKMNQLFEDRGINSYTIKKDGVIGQAA